MNRRTTNEIGVHRIRVSSTSAEAADFAQWLRARGHQAVVGDPNGDYVDGELAALNPPVEAVINELWLTYYDEVRKPRGLLYI